MQTAVAGLPLAFTEEFVKQLEELIKHHSTLAYFVLIVGTFLEGETILILFGVLAAQPRWHIHIPLVILCAFVGSLAGDQLAFFLGRFKGKGFIAKRPAWQARAARVFRLLEKFHTILILGFRFAYGLRNITPFALGMSEVKTQRFVFLNVVGAAIWATVFGMGGFLFGHALQVFLDKSKAVTIKVVLLIAAVALIVWVIRMVCRRRAAQRMAQAQAENAEDGTRQP
jgi:membrane protein DedA with SNARE-associated domain